MLYDNSTSFLQDLFYPSNSTSTKSFTLSSSVFFPALFSFIITAVCLLVFGLAIHKNWNDNLTPRAANLPKDVLKNALLYYHNQNKNKTNKYMDKLTSSKNDVELSYNIFLLIPYRFLLISSDKFSLPTIRIELKPKE